ncbi:hypothetical protein [Clostridium akagii]|uniref:hypothetical protein n=1 Tax=Clostridium akagii TaxID=91623 RepID=UPI000478C2BE|nr:hypothetical protein [Clostridium akagii]
MGYNIIDLIDKSIAIINKKKEIYEHISQETYTVPGMKIMSKVFIKEADETILYYQKLKDEIAGKSPEDINFGVYDKMSFLINEFNRKIYVTKATNVREYLKFSLGLEKDTFSLLLDLQGRFVINEDDIRTKTYKILSYIIENKEKQIEMLETVLKKY